MEKKILIALCAVLAFCYGCKTNSNTDVQRISRQLDSIAHKLKKLTFYNDTVSYRQYFFSNYNNAINDKKYEDAKNIVAAYGCVTDGVYDSVYVSTATAFINKAYPVAIDSQYAMICHFVSWNYFLNSDYPNVIQWANKSLAACTFPNAEKTKGFAYHDLAGVYVNTNRIDTAITYFLAISEIDEKANDSVGLASDYFNIGSCYYALFAYGECERYVKKAGLLYRALKDTSQWLHNEIFFPLNDKAFKLDTATTIAKIDSITKIYSQYNNAAIRDSFFMHIILAKKYIFKKDFTKATDELKECKKINAAIVDYEFKSYIDDLDTENEFAKNGVLTNTQELKNSATDLIAQSSFYEAANIYSLLAKSAANNGNLAEFKRMKDLEESLKDSIYSKNMEGQIFELDKKYQSEKKQQQISLQQKTIEAKTRAIGFLIASLIGLALVVLVFYLWQRQKKLQQEKQNSMQYTRQLLEKTEEERKRIASDLHDSISHELMNLKSSTNEGFATVNSKIDNIINDIRIISRNLHPVMFDSVGLAHTIEQMAERTQLQNNFMLTADINYSNCLPSASELQVYRIIQEAVTNIVKYANAIAGKITINERNNTVDIEIKDNGRGFNVTEVLNSNMAFGLHNIIERSRAIGGEAKIISGAQGTVIKIEIPKKQA